MREQGVGYRPVLDLKNFWKNSKNLFAFLASCVILALWGISAAGSASHWQCEGHGFESRMLHEEKSVDNGGLPCEASENPSFLFAHILNIEMSPSIADSCHI